MDKSAIVFALILLAGATNGEGKCQLKMKDPNSSGYSTITFPPELVTITPPEVLIEPIFDHKAPPPNQINGKLLTMAEGCGYSSMGVPRIVGGGPARNGAYPWMALLGYGTRGQNHLANFRCGGSLITSRHVLTAAHCAMNDLYFVRLGEHDIRHSHDGKHQDIEIMDKQKHPKYNGTLLIFDMLMLLLNNDATFTDRVRPVCLPILDDKMRSHSFVGSNPFVAGWGVISAGGDSSPFLKHVQVPYVEHAQCKHLFRIHNMLWCEETQISDHIVCAGNQEGVTSCNGDSGGPLFLPMNDGNGSYKYHQLGVVSWGFPCGKRNTPTIYSSVQFFGEWIQKMVRSFA